MTIPDDVWQRWAAGRSRKQLQPRKCGATLKSGGTCKRNAKTEDGRCKQHEGK